MKKVIAADPADRIFPIPQKVKTTTKVRDLSSAVWIILPPYACKIQPVITKYFGLS